MSLKDGLYFLYPYKDTQYIKKGTLCTLTNNSHLNPASCLFSSRWALRAGCSFSQTEFPHQAPRQRIARLGPARWPRHRKALRISCCLFSAVVMLLPSDIQKTHAFRYLPSRNRQPTRTKLSSPVNVRFPNAGHGKLQNHVASAGAFHGIRVLGPTFHRPSDLLLQPCRASRLSVHCCRKYLKCAACRGAYEGLPGSSAFTRPVMYF